VYPVRLSGARFLNGIDFARRLFLPYAFEGSTKTPASEIIGVLLLYGVLHIGKENKGWSQLE
jgi:hypothetical protein